MLKVSSTTFFFEGVDILPNGMPQVMLRTADFAEPQEGWPAAGASQVVDFRPAGRTDFVDIMYADNGNTSGDFECCCIITVTSGDMLSLADGLRWVVANYDVAYANRSWLVDRWLRHKMVADTMETVLRVVC